MTERIKSLMNIDCFKPSTINEIIDFNIQVDELYLIQVVQFCRYKFENYLEDFEVTVVDWLQIQGSSFDKCFCFVDEYGQDSYVSFENARILKKISK